MEKVKVWNLYTRITYWVIALGFFGLVITAQLEAMGIHMAIGWVVFITVLARVIYGFVVKGHTNFFSFLYSPMSAIRYLKSGRSGSPERYLGHNPAASFVMLGIIFLMLIEAALGIIVQATVEFEGPLVSLLENMGDETVDVITLLHHLLPKFIMLLVLGHFFGIFMHNKVHKENVITSMVDGKKTKTGEEKDL